MNNPRLQASTIDRATERLNQTLKEASLAPVKAVSGETCEVAITITRSVPSKGPELRGRPSQPAMDGTYTDGGGDPETPPDEEAPDVVAFWGKVASAVAAAVGTALLEALFDDKNCTTTTTTTEGKDAQGNKTTTTQTKEVCTAQ